MGVGVGMGGGGGGKGSYLEGLGFVAFKKLKY